MGLDTVELVLAVEEAFEITIPNEVAERLLTVGDMHAYIVKESLRLGRDNVNSDIVYDLLRNVICMQLGVKPEDVVPTARFTKELGAD